jgi:hypothetical protein
VAPDSSVTAAVELCAASIPPSNARRPAPAGATALSSIAVGSAPRVTATTRGEALNAAAAPARDRAGADADDVAVLEAVDVDESCEPPPEPAVASATIAATNAIRGSASIRPLPRLTGAPPRLTGAFSLRVIGNAAIA